MNNELTLQDIDALLSDYLTNRISDRSLDTLKAWMEQSDDNRAYVRKQISMWIYAGKASDGRMFDKERGKELFVQRVRQERRSRRRQVLRRVGRVAAVVLLLVLPAMGAYWYSRYSLPGCSADISVTASVGSTTHVVLPDGSSVWLNSGSKLTYPDNYGVESREVKLDGAGYFEVTRNERLPFRVSTKEISLEVLGTKFVFNSYPAEDDVTVDLLSGSVHLKSNADAQEMLLKPNERMTYNKLSHKMARTQVNASLAKDWAGSILTFDEKSLDDIAKDLMQAYRVKVEVAGNVKNKKFYGRFDTSKYTIDRLLRIMSSTQQMHYKFEEGRYILY